MNAETNMPDLTKECKCELCGFFEQLLKEECLDEEQKKNEMLLKLMRIFHNLSTEVDIEYKILEATRILNTSELTNWNAESLAENPIGHVMGFVGECFRRYKNENKERQAKVVGKIYKIMEIIRGLDRQYTKETAGMAGGWEY